MVRAPTDRVPKMRHTQGFLGIAPNTTAGKHGTQIGILGLGIARNSTDGKHGTEIMALRCRGVGISTNTAANTALASIELT